MTIAAPPGWQIRVCLHLKRAAGPVSTTRRVERTDERMLPAHP